MFDRPLSEGIDVGTISNETCSAYDEAAGEYAAATKDYLLFPGLREEVTAFAIAAGKAAPVLDLGSGAGRDSRLLACLGSRVVAGDISFSLIREALNLAKSDAFFPRHVQLDMIELPFGDGSFAGVWACGSLLHVPSVVLPRCFLEILRVLMPGGAVAVSMQSGKREGWRLGGTLPGRRWFTYVNADDLICLMKESGFVGMECRLTGRAGWYLVSARRSLTAA